MFQIYKQNDLLIYVGFLLFVWNCILINEASHRIIMFKIVSFFLQTYAQPFLREKKANQVLQKIRVYSLNTIIDNDSIKKLRNEKLLMGKLCNFLFFLLSASLMKRLKPQ